MRHFRDMVNAILKYFFAEGVSTHEHTCCLVGVNYVSPALRELTVGVLCTFRHVVSEVFSLKVFTGDFYIPVKYDSLLIAASTIWLQNP